MTHKIIVLGLLFSACDTLPMEGEAVEEAPVKDVAQRAALLDSINTFDEIDGLPCYNGKGVVKITYSDPSEVGDGPFNMTMKCVPTHPVVTFAPSYMDYGNSLGTTKYVTVTSEGIGPVSLGKAYCYSGDCASFSVTSNSCTGATLDYKTGACALGIRISSVCSYKNVYAYFKLTTNVPAGSKYVYVYGAACPIP